MTYKGFVRNGVIVSEGSVHLEEGLEVRVEVPTAIGEPAESEVPSLAVRLAEVIGKGQGLPEDWSENHDKYLREYHRR